jgi:hypothetical protein
MRLAVMAAHLGALMFAGYLANAMLAAITGFRLELH